MCKIISAALLVLIASAPAFAMDNEQEARMEQAKKEMRAMDDKNIQERRTLEDECHAKMKAMHERHQKERESLKAKYGLGKGGKEGRGKRDERGGNR